MDNESNRPDTQPSGGTEPGEPPTSETTAQTGDEAGNRLRDRAWGWRTVAATALVALLLGGAGGATITKLAGDDDHGRPQMGRFAPPGDRSGDRPGFPGRGDQGTPPDDGRVDPTTPPSTEEQDGSGTTNS